MRRILGLSRALIACAWRNSVTRFAFGAALLSTATTCWATETALDIHQLRLNGLETGLYTFDDAQYITFGLLFCFAIMVSTMLTSSENEVFLLVRMRNRGEVWMARVVALCALCAAFLGAVWTTWAAWLALTAVDRPMSAGWSAAYDHMLAAAQRNPDGLAPIYYLAVNEHLRSTSTPLVLALLQSSLFVLVFMAVGTLGAVLAQAVRRPVFALFSSVSYIFLYLVFEAVGLPALTVVTAQSSLLLSTHTPQAQPYLPYMVSFAAWSAALVVLVAIGATQVRSVRLA